MLLLCGVFSPPLLRISGGFGGLKWDSAMARRPYTVFRARRKSARVWECGVKRRFGLAAPRRQGSLNTYVEVDGIFPLCPFDHDNDYEMGIIGG